MTLTPWREVLVRKARPTLLVLMGAVGLVLLVACANVGNLTLARLVRRERELSVRAALGATPGQLRRELLVEHLVLAAGRRPPGRGHRGGRAGRPGRLRGPPHAARRRAHVERHGPRVLAHRRASLAAILFAWTPRLPAPGAVASSAAVVRVGAASTTGRVERRAQRALVAVQVAMSFIVLVGAGLLVRTFINLQRVDRRLRRERRADGARAEHDAHAARSQPGDARRDHGEGAARFPASRRGDDEPRAVRGRQRQRALPAHGRGAIQPPRAAGSDAHDRRQPVVL